MNINQSVASFRTYQAVMFEGSLTTFFTTTGTANHKKVNVEIVEGIGALVQTEKDCIIVPFPNIAIISLSNEYRDAQRKERAEDNAKPAAAQAVTKIKGDPQGAKRL